MARVLMIFEDTVDTETGQPGVTLIPAVDPNAPPRAPGTPHTGAEIAAIGLERMWKGRALAPTIALVCGDLTGLHARWQAKAAQAAANLAAGPRPDRTGATDVTGVEVQTPPPSANGNAAPGPAPAGE